MKFSVLDIPFLPYSLILYISLHSHYIINSGAWSSGKTLTLNVHRGAVPDALDTSDRSVKVAAVARSSVSDVRSSRTASNFFFISIFVLRDFVLTRSR
jgi:hypothetical protein